MSTPPPEHEHAQHRCPECGGDATRKRDRHPFTVVGSRLRLWTLYGVLLAVYVGAMVYAARWHVQQFNPSTRTIPSMRAGQSISDPIDKDTELITDLHRALDGDEQMTKRFVEKLRKATEPMERAGAVYEPHRVRFELHTYEFQDIEFTDYFFLGRLAYIQSRWTYDHPETKNPIPRGPAYEQPSTEIRWWPQLFVQIEGEKYKNTQTYILRYLNIIPLLILTVWVTALLAAAFRALRIPFASEKWFRAALMVGLILAANVSLFGISQRHTSTDQSVGSLYSTSGEWFSARTVRRYLQNPELAASMLRAMARELKVNDRVLAMYQDRPVAVVIGRDFGQLPATQPFPSTYIKSTMSRLSIGRELVLYRSTGGRYSEPLTESEQDRLRADPVWAFIKNGIIIRRKVEPMGYKAQSISILPIVLVLSIPWLLWRIMSGAHALRIRLVQRKRVNRGQCIYCAYKLPPEALAVRWDDPARGS